MKKLLDLSPIWSYVEPGPGCCTLVTGPRRTMMTKKMKVTLVWGSGYDVEKTYEFASPAEKDAFMKGVDEAIGWMDYGEKEELVAEGKLE